MFKKKEKVIENQSVRKRLAKVEEPVSAVKRIENLRDLKKKVEALIEELPETHPYRLEYEELPNLASSENKIKQLESSLSDLLDRLEIIKKPRSSVS